MAGTDSGGGAGVVADVKTFAAHGVWALCAVTAVTAQNTVDVRTALPLPPDLVAAQIDVVAADIGVDAAKTGMLAAAPIVDVVAAAFARHGIRPVVDPVMVSSTGSPLLDDAGVDALRRRLLPLAALVTPNLAEAAALAGGEVTTEADMEAAAETIAAFGVGAVLVTGGHLSGDPVDVLWVDGRPLRLPSERLPNRHTHGTGCVLSAAITAHLALGADLEPAVRSARDYVRRAIAAGIALGSGPGAVQPPT